MFRRPICLLPAEHAYAAWRAVWHHHLGPESEPLGYRLFCLADLSAAADELDAARSKVDADR